MRYEVKYKFSAKANLKEIKTYISKELQNPISAEKIIRDIIKKCDSLTLFPKASRVRLTRNARELRFTFLYHYTIVYSVDDKVKTVFIHAVIYSHRDIDSLLFN